MNTRLMLIIGFAVGVYADLAVKVIQEAHVKASGKVAVKTAEQFQREFIEQRRKAMDDDDH